MTSTFTTNKNIEKPAYTDYAADPTGWTNPVNDDWDIIDSAFGGTHTISLTNANVTLTATQCQNVRIKLTGAITANITIFFPTVISGLFIVDNATTGAFVITLASAGAGPESVVAVQSANTLIWLDATTNSVYLADNSPVQGGVGISVAGTVIDLDVPVTVTNGGTGQTNYFPGQLLIGNNAGGLTPATLTNGSNINIVNGDGTITINAVGSAGGVTTFSGGATGFTPNTATAGAVTLAGTLVVANGGTGASSLTGYVRGNGTSAMTASASIPGSALSGAYTAAALTMATNRLLGRSTASTGAAEEIAIGTGLSISGGTLNASGVVASVSASSSASGFSLSSSGSTAITITYGVSDASLARTTLGLGTIATQAANNVTVTGGTISGTSSIASSGTITGNKFVSSLGAGATNGYTFASGGGSFTTVGSDAFLNFTTNTSIFSGTSGASIGLSVNSANTASFTATTFLVGPGITAAQCYFGTTWTNISDARIKKDVTPYSLGVSALNQLRPVTYVYNGEYGSPNNGIVQTGLIAQEVLTTPLASMVGTRVYTDPNTGAETTLYDLNTNQLVFALVNAVKELSARVAELEAK